MLLLLVRVAIVICYTFSEFDKLRLPGDYTDYERGRVIFLEAPRQFVIYCSEDIAKNKAAIARIARDFSLPLSKLKVAVDAHYKMGDDIDFDDDYQEE